MVHPDPEGMFEVTLQDGHTYTFDHFEKPAPTTPVCASCGEPLAGAGVQSNGQTYCDALCAEMPRLIRERGWQVGRR